MALERRNPLPAGVYWQDFFNPPVGGASIEAIEKWLKENKNYVQALKTVYHGPGRDPLLELTTGSLYTLNPGLAAVANQLPGTGRARVWVLFKVRSPVLWPSTKFGFPTIATEAADEGDTVQRPPPEKDLADVVPTVEEMFQGAGEAAKAGSKIIAVVAAIAGILGLGWLYAQSRIIR